MVKAKQEFKKECDINTIVARYKRAGIKEKDIVGVAGQFINCANIPNLQEAFNITLEAQKAFDKLPVRFRKDMDYDPIKAIEFMTKEENIEKLVEYGLSNGKIVEKVPEVPK